MYLVRDVFTTKPGKAKELVKKFKEALPYLPKVEGGKNYRVMTDVVSNYWTVVVESEVDDMAAFLGKVRSATSSEELAAIMKGYLDLVDGGYREIFLLE